MAAQPDVPGSEWELAGDYRAERTGRRWVMVGGDEDDDAITLHVVVQHPDDDDLVKRYAVRVPLHVDEDGLTVFCCPTVTRA